MKIVLNFLDLSKTPVDMERYPVLIDIGNGKKEIGYAVYCQPPGASGDGWYEEYEQDAKSVNVIGWAKIPRALKE
jgi:hypothetical protein